MAKYDLAIRAWAERDPMARRAVNNVYRRRAAFITELFESLGFSGQELEMRTRMFLVYHIWEKYTLKSTSKAERRALRRKRCEMLAKR